MLFSLSSWQPDRERLRDWMAAQLCATYPGAPWAQELLKAGLVLPVLDGLDECWATLAGENWSDYVSSLT
ncbi:hypothetical protein [Streptomyces sp. NPDC005209]|uniref:hypothetical protein n=1 Tax=Streptomyces sp. NPDC005209 TaxID=3156715 RepID=UPI0033AF68C6